MTYLLTYSSQIYEENMWLAGLSLIGTSLFVVISQEKRKLKVILVINSLTIGGWPIFFSF